MGIASWVLAGGVPLLAALLFVPRELCKRWRGRLVDRLDHGVRRRVSRFHRRYREFVLGSLRFVDLKGLATVGFYTPELDEVFVDVSLVHEAPHRSTTGVVAAQRADATARYAIGDLLDKPKPVVLAVIGAPGSGKTTLLRHTAREGCRRRRRRSTPVLLYLRDHVDKIVAKAGVSLPDLVRQTIGRHATAEPPGWFEQRLHNGDCVVLLDGLDEVARQADRRAVADWVERQTKEYPRNDYVITSRPEGYRSAPVDGAVVLQVRGFTDKQVARFIRGWYVAVGKQDPSGPEAADDLLARLDDNPALFDLTGNPLLLTMIANIHRYRGALPGSRADLYDEICQVMLWRRQKAKKLPAELSGDRKEILLRGLAFAMMRRQVRDMPRDDVLAEFRSMLLRMSTPVTEDKFLAEVCAYGLLVERENGLFSFAHLTFQEALAAGHIRAKGLTDVLVEAVNDPWWRETTLLYVTKSDADPIVRACFDNGDIPALSLAFDCHNESSDLAPELRDELEKLLDVENPRHRRRRVSILVARHLRDLIQTDAGGRMCTRPVSTEIYRLFLNETGRPAPDGPERGSDEPIIGVRADDADAFIAWANVVTPAEPLYRLPRREEIEDRAARRALAKAPGLLP